MAAFRIFVFREFEDVPPVGQKHSASAVFHNTNRPVQELLVGFAVQKRESVARIVSDNFSVDDFDNFALKAEPKPSTRVGQGTKGGPTALVRDGDLKLEIARC